MRWDIFCKVIDNHGDIGVCWRLSRDLAWRGHSVRLWVDDRSALAWMAPEVWPDGRGHAGIEVRDWPSAATPLPHDIEPAEVVIEAFGCDLPNDFVARMQRPEPPCWLNLEYLSAEDYVERSHGLSSPVFSGPGAGLKKRFFYPGFTPRTGGLLREAGWLARVAALASSDEQRQQALQALGVNWHPGQRVVTLFCYENSPVEALLRQLSSSCQQMETASKAPPWLVLLTPGHASRQAGAIDARGLSLPGLQLQRLPALPQPAFDTLLACSDLNFVRGEDSAVRALWAGRPHVWQIYRQDDGVHAEKLHAFMDRWMLDWPVPLRHAVTALWAQWNTLPGLTPSGHAEAPPPEPDLSALGPLLGAREWQSWQQASHQSSQNLARQDDLATQLLAFVGHPG